jgi:hypothetical protein
VRNFVSDFRGRCGFRVFESRLTEEIFVPNRKKVIRGWKKFHYDDLIIYTIHQIILDDRIKENETEEMCEWKK